MEQNFMKARLRDRFYYAYITLIALFGACSHCRHEPDHVKTSEVVVVSITPHNTKCWSLETFDSCRNPDCHDDNDCCSREKLGCTQHKCGGTGCEYPLDTASPACTCMPGDCSPDGTQFCGCTPDGSGNVSASAFQACPADYPTCDVQKRRCVCRPGLATCTVGGGGYTFCNADGAIETEPCPPSTPECRDGKCQCVANSGKTCGCGGTIGCDGTCSAAGCARDRTCTNGSCCIPTKGNSCGSCGGMIQCDGTCSVPTPSNFGQSCGSCGGRIQCNGSCTVPTPGNLGQACGACGGQIQCNGLCSVATPGNFGQACGECGGTITCNGGCSNTTPRCPPGFSVDPSAAGQCRSSDRQVYHSTFSIGGTPPFNSCDICGCGLSKDINIAIACGSGRVQSRHTAGKIEGGNGHCEGVWANNNNVNDCSIRLHYGTGWCDHFTCDLQVYAVDRRLQCSP